MRMAVLPSGVLVFAALVMVAPPVVWTEGCSGRQVYNETSGVVTDGIGNYPESAHCEWLIDAGGPNKFIDLQFISMDTECSYDYLFVYDGDSYSSPLLGSFSGKTTPDLIMASSGYMLIYFFSDRNYVLGGFYAKYKILDCPQNCSSHGICDARRHRCSCSEGFTGDACDLELCPSLCGVDHGRCEPDRHQGFSCSCHPGYVGYGCTLSVNTTNQEQGWYQISPPETGFTPRSGHAGAFIDSVNSLYIFGGHTLNGYMDELIRYNFAQSAWEILPVTELWPRGRHQHSITAYRNGFYMFGGILQNETHSNELWFYDVIENQWSVRAANSDVQPTGVASHTVTLVDDQWLYLFGGRTTDGQFLSDIYRISVFDDTQWIPVQCFGGKEADRRLVGHSTVYHPQSRSLLVFGGFLPDCARFPKRTDQLHAFHIDHQYWSLINYETSEGTTPPKHRAFHSAAIMDNYMVVFGGNPHIHHDEEVCYDRNIYFYHLGCHRWIHSDTFLPDSLEDDKPQLNIRGRFSHMSAVAWGNILLVAGGYRGHVLGDLMAYVVPLAVAKNKFDAAYFTDIKHCHIYTELDQCLVDPECAWCSLKLDSDKPACLQRTDRQECSGSFQTSDCPGICGALIDCTSCAIQGHGHDPVNERLRHLWHNEQCSWCVQDSTCQKRAEPSGLCDPTQDTPTGVVGWWGVEGTRLNTTHQCRVNNFPAGLHWVSYRNPANFHQPDHVELIPKTYKRFHFEPEFEQENKAGGTYTAKALGFIHPLGAASSNGSPLKVWLVGMSGTTSLYMSSNADPTKKELVANISTNTYLQKEARRRKGEPIFPHEGRGYKYYFEQITTQSIAEPGMSQGPSLMQLDWTGALKEPSRVRQKISREFLEPYHSNNCTHYPTCLACMTDVSCGWCSTSATCVDKTQTESGVCPIQQGEPHLVLTPGDCPVCADHIDCHSCAQVATCEWLTEEARCLRRGRYSVAVRDSALCPLPCQQRSNCSWCVSENNECAWCEETQTCFPFVEYMMRFSYGGCTHWIDSMSDQTCHDCSQHLTCSNCLSHFQCGWCGNDDNPLIGRCLHGHFPGPVAEGSCGKLISEVQNISEHEPSDWHYGICPDVEECRLGLDDCHPNATCHNTFQSFECTCNRGFMGNGRDMCDMTCYYDCIHGNCSGAPDYQCLCDIGYTGVQCVTDCGCHAHSTCLSGVGSCDQCQHWTTGQYCDHCLPGSYGNATAPQGCLECECNGHANSQLGFCNKTTGVCFCQDNTQGQHCQLCQDGYYGDPRNGGRCYLKCEGRTILANITSGALGSHAGLGVSNKLHSYCLWILTVHSDLTTSGIRDSVNPLPSITFTILPDIKVDCNRDFVYVYDGIPSFMVASEGASSRLLAVFCGFGLLNPGSVVATSGSLTVYFEGTHSRGFNATYHINQCPESCQGNRRCHGNECVCAEGWGGMDCTTELCPHNCWQELNQGLCNETLGQCVCQPGFASPDCSSPTSSRNAIYTSMIDPMSMPDMLTSRNLLSRMGHSFIACNDNPDFLYMFGGYSLSRSALNDLWLYHVISNEWKQLKSASSESPLPRYFHAAVCIPTLRAMFVFGGLSDRSGAKQEMWRYNLDSSRWSELEVSLPDLHIPAMAGHTMTLIDNTTVWIIGGFSSWDYFSEYAYEYDASNNHWARLQLRGATPTGLFAHSAVLHPASGAIYVFGGYEYQTDKTIPSNNLYALDIESRSWSVLPSEQGNRPVRRYMHSAVNVGDYMVVIGGRQEQREFDSSVMAYRYACNQWMNISAGVENIYGAGPRPVIGGRAEVAGGNIYIMGGFNSISHGNLVRLTLPDDLCALLDGSKSCANATGCAMCTVHETNATYCYDNSNQRPLGCLIENTTVSIRQSETCDQQRIESRQCEHHRTCTECLAQWPYHDRHKQVCEWCSKCPLGKCVAVNSDCQAANPCSAAQEKITNVNKCVERKCQAGHCESCRDKGRCFWTRQLKQSSEVGGTLSYTPIFDWNCVTDTLLMATKLDIQSSPPLPCPMRCYQYLTCKACLGSLGGEGGEQGCIWSAGLQECMPPAYFPLHCSNGECGHMLEGQPDQCLEKCAIHIQCSHCLATPGCGWCALGGLKGIGVCMEGGLTGSHQRYCVTQNFSSLPMDTVRDATGPPSWAFGKCPPENECQNGHHTCDTHSEDCVDLLVGFKCVCKEDYKRDHSMVCKPVCLQGCSPHGICVRPNQCQCLFGYVGENCSVECQCNKHSNCRGVNHLNHCIECLNNTQGSQCEECKSLFVGDPHDGGQCQKCFQFCNNHTAVCMTKSEYKHIQGMPIVPTDPAAVSKLLGKGPKSKEEAVCFKCQNNTEGEQCQTCQHGYFRLKKQLHSQGCMLCQCNGHSDTCDSDTGINCQCQNNTKSPMNCKNDDDKNPCYKQQCSKCIENFLGKPTGGHQCFRTMTVDLEYCLDPHTQSFCTSIPANPAPLHPNRTVFYGVQPRFMNVDIRIVVDITQGGVDLYFSPLHHTFIVNVDKLTGIHSVSIDPTFRYVNHSVPSPATPESRQKRAITKNVHDINVDKTGSDNATDASNEVDPIYRLYTQEAEGFITSIRVMDPQAILVIRNIQNRLVITIPNNAHRLQVAKYYLVLYGVGDARHKVTYGNAFFRQDQPRIDLFVFFSVFFSCFFLFLSGCVLLWKVKQAVDSRRSSQQRRMEMQHMASRPFGKVLLLVDSGLFNTATNSLPPLLRKSRLSKIHSKHHTTAVHPASTPQHTQTDESFHVYPVTIEPLDDGIAAVGTVVIQLPGGATSPMQACLGSSLITSRLMYPGQNHHHVYGSKSTINIRRRPSVSV